MSTMVKINYFNLDSEVFLFGWTFEARNGWTFIIKICKCDLTGFGLVWFFLFVWKKNTFLGKWKFLQIIFSSSSAFSGFIKKFQGNADDFLFTQE